MKITVYSLSDCPKCGSTNVRHWSRITGYYTDVTGWNEGKHQELRDRYRVSLTFFQLFFLIS